jgi:DNA repair protein RadC
VKIQHTYKRVVSRLEIVKDSTTTLSSPHTAYDFVRLILENEPQEVFLAILLDSKHKPTAVVEVSRGTLTASLVHPREVFGPVLRIGTAQAIIIAHNHPSGDPMPSEEDKQITMQLREAGNLLDVPVLDHIIIGKRASSFSFMDAGLLK